MIDVLVQVSTVHVHSGQYEVFLGGGLVGVLNVLADVGKSWFSS